MNNQLKKELTHITFLLAGIALLGAIWTGYQTQNSVIEIYAKEKPYFEPISFIEPTIEEKILEVFGDEGDLMIAIMKAEHRGTVNSTAVNSTEVEHSVGLFQINLADGFGNGRHIHWDKVKGETLREKEDWLKVPKNNIAVAKIIRDAQGLSAWSVYLNGLYKTYEK